VALPQTYRWYLEAESGGADNGDVTPAAAAGILSTARTAGDVRVVWVDGMIDCVIESDDLATDRGLRTAVLLSLFTDRRAEADDSLPSEDGDRRGWWADEFSEHDGDRIGSRLWLLDRSARRPEVGKQAEEYVRESLAWLVDDRVVDSVGVDVEVAGTDLRMRISFERPREAPITYRFAGVWQGEAART